MLNILLNVTIAFLLGSVYSLDCRGRSCYLRDNLYRHYRVLRMTGKARRAISELFEALMADVALMPPEHCEAATRMERESGQEGRARAVADYVAGMTDRYAILEHRRLLDPSERT